MNAKELAVVIVGLTVFMGAVYPAYAENEQTIEQLRNLQDQEYAELRKIYDSRGYKVKKNSPASKALLDEYTAKRNEIRQKYSQLETRGGDVQSMMDTPDFKGKVQNTGSMPGAVNADVDLATDSESAQKLANKWKQKGGKPPQYYTVDNPSVPTTTPPDDFNKVIKVVNPNTDTTVWTPETEAIRKAKLKDPDAWTTSGGQKATGNTERSRDKRGYYLDNEKKFHHADRPVANVPGTHDEDLKTFSKSVSKAGGSQGANIAKDNPGFYEQASKLQKYGDPVEAGIVDLGDSPEVRQQKLEKWKQTARDEMKKAKAQSEKLGDAADTAREDLAQQMRDQGNDDVAERIEQHRQDVANSNRDAATENKILKNESEEIRNNRKNSNTADTDSLNPGGDVPANTKVADQAGYGEIKVGKPGSASNGGDGKKLAIQDLPPLESSPEEIKDATKGFKPDDGGIKRNPDNVKWVDGDPEIADLADPTTKHLKKPDGDKAVSGAYKEVEKIKKANLDADTPSDLPPTKQQKLTADSPNTTKIGPGKGTDIPSDVPLTKQQKVAIDGDIDLTPGNKKVVKTAGVDVDVPNSKKNLDVDGAIDASAVVESAAQVFQSGTKAAGNAIDENRDLNSDDALQVVGDMTPGVREYEASQAALQQRRLESLDRQEKIRQLESRENLTLDEELELNHLKHEEAQNPNTIGGDLSAVVTGAEQHYLDEKDKRKKADGREGEADNFIQDGLPMAADMVIDAVNAVNPYNQIGTPVAEGVSEVLTWESRQGWASQKDTITKYLNSEATKIEKGANQKIKDLNQLLAAGDLSNPEVQKRLDSLLEALEQDQDRIQKLNAAANEHLQDVDPEKLAYLNGVQSSLPDIKSLYDWRNQLTEEQRIANSCPENTVRISAENETKKCVSCAELESDFHSSLGEGYITYSESLLTRAETCAWTSGARDKLLRSRAGDDCDKQKPGSVPVFSSGAYECRCSPGSTASVADSDNQAQCVSCDELYGDFNVAIGANEKDYAQLILELSAGCGWIAEGTKRLENYGNCPDDTVRLSDESDTAHCVTCGELQGDFNAALDMNDKGYAQMLLEAAQNCGWVSAGKDKMQRARNCPENSVKLSDENDNIECVPCGTLHGEFNAALSSGDKEYAQSLVDFAPNCDWAISGNQRIKDSGNCPGNTVKLSDNNGQNQCVPCDELYSDFNGAVSSGDSEYAQTLVDLGVSCGWSNQAQNALNTPQACPEGTVKLSDQNNQAECVPCSTLYGDYTAAMGQGDTSYAESLVSLASVCSWSQSVAQQMQNENQQAALDQKCEQQAPGSHAVINGDRYTCQCDAGMLALTGPSGTSCQSCEQIRSYINSALQNNDLGTVRGLMAGAQNCEWYDQAVQVVSGLEQDARNQNNQQLMNEFQNQMNAFMNQNNWMSGSDDIPDSYYDKKNNPKPTVSPTKPPQATPKPKPPPKRKPAKQPQAYSFKPPDCPQNGPRNKTINTKTSRCTYDKYGIIKNAYRRQ